MALWLHTLVVVWYVTRGQHSRFAHLPALPWYSKSDKTKPVPERVTQ